MALYDFSPQQQFTSIEKLPDNRNDQERLNSPLSLYNHDNPDLAYAERLAEEMTNLSGAWITVYKRERNQAGRDEVWEEDADPVYKTGVKIKGKFVPAPAEIQLTRYGVDVPNKTTIHFPRTVVYAQFGREMIAEGDVLVVPHNTLTVTQNTDLRDGADNRIDMYRVIRSADVGNFKYRWLFWECNVEQLTGDKTIDIPFRKESS